MVQTKAVRTGFSRKRSPQSIQADKLQVKFLCEFIGATLASVSCPSDAIKSYVRTVRRRLNSEGNGFLKPLRNLFIQGVKTLGGDTPVFSGWSLKDGYPRLFNWVFKELEHERENCDSKRISALLSILYSARAVKLRSSAKAEEQALSEFVSRVTHPDYNLGEVMETKEHSTKLLGSLPNWSVIDRFPYGARFNPTLRGQKCSSLWKGEEALIPELLARCVVVEGTYTGTLSRSFPYFRKKGPLGKVTILPEKAGKYRVIVGYNGFVHATDLYDRCRAVLDTIKQDVSKDQSIGHRHACLLSASVPSRCYVAPEKPIEPFNEPTVTKGRRLWPFAGRVSTVERRDPPNIMFVSADLSAFTDNMLPGAILACLTQLKAANLYPLITEGTVMLPDGSLIKPRTALMGFKGCFEMSSILHHAAMQHFVGKNYSMCGDDVVGAFDVQQYENAVGTLGLKLNRDKTVVSVDTTTFCGKVYFRGLDVSPYVPPIRSLVNGEKDSVFQAARSALDGVKSAYPAVMRSVRRIVLECLGHYPGYISKELPHRLGGFYVGLRNRPLLQVLAEKRNLLIASNNVKTERLPVETRSRGTLPGVPFTGLKVLPWTNLYLEGGISLPRKHRPSKRRMGPLVSLVDILNYLYDGVGIPARN